MIKNPRRLKRLDPFGVCVLWVYGMLLVWGIWCVIDPVKTLAGAAGDTLTLLVSIAIMIGSTIGFFGYLAKETAERSNDVIDVEPIGTLILFFAWGTYTITSWLLVAGFGLPLIKPVVAPFAVTVSIIQGLIIIRSAQHIYETVKLIRQIQAAHSIGIDGGTSPEDAIEKVQESETDAVNVVR